MNLFYSRNLQIRQPESDWFIHPCNFPARLRRSTIRRSLTLVYYYHFTEAAKQCSLTRGSQSASLTTDLLPKQSPTIPGLLIPLPSVIPVVILFVIHRRKLFLLPSLPLIPLYAIILQLRPLPLPLSPYPTFR